MSTNDFRDYYLDVWIGLTKDHKLSSAEAVAYGLEEISKNDSGEIEIVDGIDSDGSAAAAAA